MEDGKKQQGENRDRSAPGRDTKRFFTAVVNAQRDTPEISEFRPELRHEAISIADEWFSRACVGHFDAHIFCSIPTFFELTRVIAFGIVAHHRSTGTGKHVDLGASEGTLCAAVACGSNGGIKTYAVEPNPNMIRRIESQPYFVNPIVEALDVESGYVIMGKASIFS